MQACRGGKFDYGVESESTDGGEGETEYEEATEELMEKQVTVTVHKDTSEMRTPL